MIRILLIAACCWAWIGLSAQETEEDTGQIMINGELVTYTVVDNDTLLIADLDGFSVSSPRTFKDRDEKRKFLKYKRYANVVYPYAVKAIKIFRETDEVTRTMKKRKKQKHIKRLQKKMDDEFKEPLKKLTKTQGYILIKMIEKELDTCLLYTSPSPRDATLSRMPSSA